MIKMILLIIPEMKPQTIWVRGWIYLPTFIPIMPTVAFSFFAILFLV